MDYRVFKWINQLSGRCSPIDSFMILLSNKVRYVFIFVLIFMWFKNKPYKKVACNALVSAAIAFVINPLVKLFYFKPRPFIKRRVGILIPAKADSSFPSKHTLLVFAISSTIFLYQRSLGLIMSILSALTGFSRIWVGHHYPSDIIGSALIAAITSILYNKMSRCLNYFSRQ